MSTFEITGVVTATTPKTSQAGKAYLAFTLVDGESTFDLSLFGAGMNLAKALVKDKKVNVKGILSSREYQGKHYPNFQVQWVEAVVDKAVAAAAASTAAKDNDAFADIPF